MNRNRIILGIVLGVLTVLTVFTGDLRGDFLYTVDRKVYEGKMVDFKYSTIYFNVYKFGKVHRTERFPLSMVWKIEFTEPQKEGMESRVDIEQNYNHLRKGKRIMKVLLPGNRKWVDTGLDVRIGQEILFSASGSIKINKNTLVYQSGEEYVNWNQNKPLPNQPTGAVIARVGKNADLFYIGDDKAPFQMGGAGRLFLGINDDNAADNTGQFTITIYY